MKADQERNREELLKELSFLREDYAELEASMAEMQLQAHALVGMQSKMESLLNNASEGIVILNPDESIQSFNRRAEFMFGIREVDIAGGVLDQVIVVPENFSGSVTAWLRHYCNTTPDMLEQPLIGMHADGHEVPLRVSISEVASNDMVLFDDDMGFGDDTPSFDLFICILHDLTDELATHRLLEQQREDLAKANNVKTQFMARVSHELRTPLNGILPMAELLQNTCETEEQREYVGTILDASQSLLKIINNMLEFNELNQAQGERECQDVHLKAILENLLHEYLAVAKEKNLVLDFDLDAGLPTVVQGVPEYLQRILEVLVDNAIKFTEKGHVRIEVLPGRQDNEVRIGVRDTGIGIPESAIPGLFQSFSQNSDYMTRSYEGTGLGLSIAQQTAEHMGTDIQVESEPRVGSCFFFYMPLCLSLDASGAGSDVSPALNPDVIGEMQTMMGDALGELIEGFIGDTDQALERLADMSLEHDKRSVICRELIAMGSTIGAQRLVLMAENLEQSERDDVPTAVAELSEEFERVRVALNALN